MREKISDINYGFVGYMGWIDLYWIDFYSLGFLEEF